MFTYIYHYLKLQNHLEEATRLNPSDYFAQYFLGRWYYGVSFKESHAVCA